MLYKKYLFNTKDHNKGGTENKEERHVKANSKMVDLSRTIWIVTLWVNK